MPWATLPRIRQESRENLFVKLDEDCVLHNIKARPRRCREECWDAHYFAWLSRTRDNCWKKHRQTQYRIK